MNSTHRLVGVVAVAALFAGAPARAAWLNGNPAGPINWPGDQAQTEKFSKTVPLAKGGSLDLANISGDIVVTGGAGDQIVIDAVKRGKTAEDLKAVAIEVTATANRVEVRAQYPRERRNVNVSVDFTVSVPRGASVRVHSVSGDLKVATVDGALTAETVSGDVVLSSVAQLERARSVSGNVTIETGGSDGDIAVESVSGDVVLKAVKARAIETKSVSGDLDLADVTCERVKANSISGDIVYGGPLAKGGRYVFQAHSGDITIYTDAKAGFEMNANTFSGDISSDLKLVSTFGGEPPAGDAPPGRGTGHGPGRGGPGQRVRGTYGDGGAFLELNAFSGDVKIVSKAVAKVITK
jgi:DUF4097 and DUF4098 domain-containing protein YvlB